MRKLFTVWNTSSRPSALTRSRILLSAMNVPVRPAPALQHTQKQKKHLKNEFKNDQWPSYAKHHSRKHNQAAINSSNVYLQCTTMGWFPDCCCCLCTEAMMSIMPFPSAGMPTSGQPWKWKCRITLVCFSFERKCTGRIEIIIPFKYDLLAVYESV